MEKSDATPNDKINTDMSFFDKEGFSLEETLLIQRTLRSGQAVDFAGNVVVLGDVNPGAEITATGHIVVVGALRGLVHAGAQGYLGATIIALTLEPTQLRIGEYITRPPDGVICQKSNVPEIAHISGDSIVIEFYQP